MLYTFIKANNTAAGLYILNIVTVQSLQSMLQITVLPEKLTVAQLLIQFLTFYRTRGFIPNFNTASLTPSHLITVATYLPFSHIFYTEDTAMSLFHCFPKLTLLAEATITCRLVIQSVNIKVDCLLSREYFTSDAIYNGSAGTTLYYYTCRSWQDCCRRGKNQSWPSVSVESVDSECWCLNYAMLS